MEKGSTLTDDFMQSVTNKMVNELNNKLEQLFIEGLKLKGFGFNNRIDLENFISHNCRCEDNRDLQEKIYYVNNIPFLLHVYKIDMNLTYNDTYTLTGNYGHYKFL